VRYADSWSAKSFEKNFAQAVWNENFTCGFNGSIIIHATPDNLV